MNWMTIGAIALVAIALLGIGSTVVSTGPILGTTSGVVAGTTFALGHTALFGGPGNPLPCTPGVPGCE